MIQLPIEIGDIVLGGKFKNKKITVKEIGVDEYGLPTINGRGILKIRIQKLMKPKNIKENDTKVKPFQSSPTRVKIKKEDKRFYLYLQTVNGEECLTPLGFETKELAAHNALMKGYEVDNYTQPTNLKESLKLVIREIIAEINLKKKLSEVDVNDPELAKIIDELGSLQEQLDNAEAEIAALKKKLNVGGLQKQIKILIDEKLNTLVSEMDVTGERLARTENIVMRIERSGYTREDPKYKEGWLEALQKVNAATKKVLRAVLAAHTSTTKVAASLSFSKRNDEWVITEINMYEKFVNWLTKMIDNLAPKLATQGEKIDNALDKLERILKIN